MRGARHGAAHGGEDEMVVGLGIDLIEVARLQDLLERHPERAFERLFSAEERAECESRADPFESLAARFAAKEAFLKALGTGLRGGLAWRDMTVRNVEHGRPEFVTTDGVAERLDRLGGASVHLSLTHDAGMAAAVVVIEAPAPPA